MDTSVFPECFLSWVERNVSGRWAVGPGSLLALGRVLATGQFRACAHLEAVVSSCRAGLRLRSGLHACASEPSPRPSHTPSEPGKKAKEEEKKGMWAEGVGGVRAVFLF